MIFAYITHLLKRRPIQLMPFSCPFDRFLFDRIYTLILRINLFERKLTPSRIRNLKNCLPSETRSFITTTPHTNPRVVDRLEPFQIICTMRDHRFSPKSSSAEPQTAPLFGPEKSSTGFGCPQTARDRRGSTSQTSVKGPDVIVISHP